MCRHVTNKIWQEHRPKEEAMAETELQPSPTGRISPLLTKSATERTGNAQLPGAYCRQRHVWLVEGAPIVEALSNLAELTTKTEAQLERDDSSDPSLLELQTKTKAEAEQDDQDWNSHILGLTTKTFANLERDD